VAGEAKAGGDIGAGGNRIAARGEECGKRQQLVPVGLAGRGRDGAPGARRDVDQGIVGARRGAAFEIESEAQLGEQRQLPAHIERRPDTRIVEEAEDEQRDLVEIGMGIALGQQAGEAGQRGQPGEGQRAVHRTRRVAVAQFERHVAEAFGEAPLPARIHVIAGLKHRTVLARAPAVHEADVATVRAREQLDHRRRLAVRSHREHDCLVLPVHRRAISPFAW